MRWLAFIISAFIAGSAVDFGRISSPPSPLCLLPHRDFRRPGDAGNRGPYSVSGAVVGTVVVTFARELLRAIENYINILQVFPEDSSASPRCAGDRLDPDPDIPAERHHGQPRSGLAAMEAQKRRREANNKLQEA